MVTNNVSFLRRSRFTPTLQMPLARGVFDAQVSAMQSFYKTLPPHAFPLDSRIQWIGGVKLPPLAPDAMTEINSKAKSRAENWLNNVRDNLNLSFQNLQATGNPDDWDRLMNEAEEKAQQEAHEVIHAFFEDVRVAGTNDPSKQPQLLKKAQNAGSFLTNLANDVKNFFVRIFEQVKQWIAAAVAWIEQAAKDVAEWVGNAIDDIGDFFGI